jgi:hypothetical protein
MDGQVTKYLEAFSHEILFMTLQAGNEIIFLYLYPETMLLHYVPYQIDPFESPLIIRSSTLELETDVVFGDLPLTKASIKVSIFS